MGLRGVIDRSIHSTDSCSERRHVGVTSLWKSESRLVLIGAGDDC